MTEASLKKPPTSKGCSQRGFSMCIWCVSPCVVGCVLLCLSCYCTLSLSHVWSCVCMRGSVVSFASGRRCHGRRTSKQSSWRLRVEAVLACVFSRVSECFFGFILRILSVHGRLGYKLRGLFIKKMDKLYWCVFVRVLEWLWRQHGNGSLPLRVYEWIIYIAHPLFSRWFRSIVSVHV